jgi:hypothetical protein
VTHSLQLYDKSSLLGALRTQLIKSAVPIGLAVLLVLALTPNALPVAGQSSKLVVATVGISSVTRWEKCALLQSQEYRCGGEHHRSSGSRT